MRDDALILLVEDREDDILIMLRSFDQAGIKNPVQVVRDGDEAMEYLGGEGKYSNRHGYPLPELVLLDLRMPKVDGFEVLRWIRLRPDLSGLRVVVLTSSADIRDVNMAYAMGANSFLVKPMDFNRFVELSSFIADNWFHWNTSPHAQPGARRQTSDGAGSNKKVHLRERSSQRFYGGRDEWVAEKERALDFERIDLAEAVATAERLNEVEIVLAYEQPPCELTLPIAFPGVRRT
jgi:CheY-like chemotaxis protein